MMRRTFLTCLTVLCLHPTAHADPIPGLYTQLAAHPAQRCLELDIDLTHGEAATFSAGTLSYPMRDKAVAEGWSWPEHTTTDTDYYLYKYLPLATESEDRRTYEMEDKVGEPQLMTERWRYDYFFAFNNLNEFSTTDDDDAALLFSLPTGIDPASVGLRAEVCLSEPVTRESTTFWKATYGKPVDLTLKKRYLVGSLRALHVIAPENGQRLASLHARPDLHFSAKE